MASDSKRNRSTSAAQHDDTGSLKRRKTRSPVHGDGDEEAEQYQPEASTSKAVSQQQRRPPQSQIKTKRAHQDSMTNRPPLVQNNRPHASPSTGTDMNNKAPSSASQQAGKSTARTVHRMSGAHGHTALMQEHADLQARYEEQMANYQALHEAYQALHDLRETGPEVTLRESVTLNEGRLNAMRKQVSNYKKESEELQTQADALKEEIATLADKQENAENGESGPSRRTTMKDGDETMEDASRHAETSKASDRKLEETIQHYEIEKERLEKDHKHLLEQVGDLEEQLNQSKKEKKAIQKQWAAEREQLEMSLKRQWEEDRKSLLAEREELVNRAEQLEKELAFEVEQSKKLQAAASAQSAASQPKLAAPKTPSNGTIAEQNSTDSSTSNDDLVRLLLDFTGMTLVRKPQEGDKTYNFVMTDFKKRKALNFKLIVDHETGSVDFIPDLLPGRDDEVIANMENAIRGHIKFEYDLIQTFFKRLWRALNGHK